MTEKEIFDRIVTIVQERQGEDFVVTESLSLKDDLDADSVDLMEFILTLEDEFNIEISDEEIDQLQSVGDVVKIIQAKQKSEFQGICFGIFYYVTISPSRSDRCETKKPPAMLVRVEGYTKKLQTRYNKGVQVNCKAKGEKYGTKGSQFIAHKVAL